MTPYLGSIPYLDGNIDFVKSYDFYSGGLDRLFKNWPSVHPPMKLLVTNTFYSVFGINLYSYNFVGVFLGTSGITAYYFFVKGAAGQYVAKISTLLLAINPLFVSVGIFALIDYILTVLIVIAFYFYSKNRYLAYSLSASMALLTKETGILFAASILLIETLFFIKNFFSKKLHKQSVFNLFLTFVPFVVISAWFSFLQTRKVSLWSDWNFSATSDKGTIYTIFHNLLTFSFLNKYSYQNWLQLFFLNFNWIYWLSMITGLFIYLKKYDLVRVLKENQTKLKVFLSIILFFTMYFFSILTFQTYTIPRYALLLYPFIIFGFALSILTLNKIRFLRGKVFCFSGCNYLLTNVLFY